MALYTDYHNPRDLDTDYVAINNAIRNILLTSKGSLPGKPTFGSRMNQVPFSHMDSVTKDLIEKLVVEAISKQESRIQIIAVDIEYVEEYNKCIVTVNYTYTDAELNKNSQISLSLFT